MTNPTQHEKTLAIAKAMYGNTAVEVNALDEVLLPIEVGQHGIRPFNPYTSAEDCLAVQEFFKIDADWENNEWNAYHTKAGYGIDKDLKTAIADCAYEITKG